MENIVLYAVTVVVGLIAWLLKSKDDKQGKEISLLFQKHDIDAQALADLRLEIAKEHYIKRELDQRFDHLEVAFNSGFSAMGMKFDALAKVLTDHMMIENGRRKNHDET